MDTAGCDEDKNAATDSASSVMLTSLASTFVKEQHQTYLNRLEQAIRNPKNRNIALTGHYGAGKSSVLDRFEESSQLATLRLAISTLSPDSEGASVTNRIQKELVKQIVYSAAPETLQHSQFRRLMPFPWKRVLNEIVVVVGLIITFLGLMGWSPPIAEDHHWLIQTLAWFGLAVVLSGALLAFRWATHGKYFVSDVSAGGAAVTLTKQAPTYFDKYLDDIVNYFDTENVSIVIFEDLDRFNDPQIFEALRELNTLLNKTRMRVESNTPLRFIYAVRDSLFERLGTETEAQEDDDVASVETMRANRTKFFDLVIPLVPFISHRNARELLVDLLEEAQIEDIDRRLINLVAKHCTDMRLLHNISNEYLVFAERLLASKKVAPGLNPSNLFALIAYKNFHLKDFENIARRTSNLDSLYDFRRKLIRKSIAEKQQRKRDIVSRKVRVRTRAKLAEELASRLLTLAEVVRKTSPRSGWQYLYFYVGEHEFLTDELKSYEFWQAISRSESLKIETSQTHSSARYDVVSLNKKELATLIPMETAPERWNDLDEEAARGEVIDIDREIAFLRGADFADLSRDSTYTEVAPVPESADGPVSENDQNSRAPDPHEKKMAFGNFVDKTMDSELARDLVKRGYIDRNFALYAAQFYGHFTGTDVANFMVHNVQTNTMELDYPFVSSSAVANLLIEADEDFTYTVAAYNIDVLNYLLGNDDERAANIANSLVANFDEDSRMFLTAYFTSGASPEKFVAQLVAVPWDVVFIHLTTRDAVPEDNRVALVDAALGAIDPGHTYDLGPEVRDFIATHYDQMKVFIHPQESTITENVAAFLKRADILIPDISVLDEEMRVSVVLNDSYRLTSLNLSQALDSSNVRGESSDISLDRVSESRSVSRYCFAYPDDYLAAVDNVQTTSYAVFSPGTLVNTLTDTVGTWSEQQVDDLIRQSAPESRLDNLCEAPTSVWPSLAKSDRFRVSLANVERYRREIGSIDDDLAELLAAVNRIHTGELIDTVDESGEPFDREAAATAILNTKAIGDPVTRVILVQQLEPVLPIAAENISPEASELFGQLIEHGVIADESESFTHFQRAGWPALGPAIAVSKKINEFLTPELVAGMVGDLLSDVATSDDIGREVVARLDEFVIDDDASAFRAAVHYADVKGISMAPETVVRMAEVARPKSEVVLRVLAATVPHANSQQIRDVFVEIGEPYNNINHPGAQFEIDKNEVHNVLLKTLSNDKVCTYRKKPLKETYMVDVLEY